MTDKSVEEADKKSATGDVDPSEVFTYLGCIKPVHFYLHIQARPIPAEFVQQMCVQVCNYMIYGTMLGRGESVLVFHVTVEEGSKLFAMSVTPINAPIVTFSPKFLHTVLLKCVMADRSQDKTAIAIKVGHSGKTPFDFRGALHLYEIFWGLLAWSAWAKELAEYFTDAQSLIKGLAKEDKEIAVSQVGTTKPLSYLPGST